LEQVAGTARKLPEACLERILEVRALCGASCTLLRAGAGACLQLRDAFRDAPEFVGDLSPELVVGRAGTRGVEELREPRAITVEVFAEKLAEATHRRLAPVLVEAGELPFGQLEAADDDTVADDVDLRAATHARIIVGRCGSLRVAIG